MSRILSSLFVFLIFSTTAHAQLRIDITEGNVDPIPIAIPAFQNLTPGANQRLNGSIADVITSNLERSGLFRAIDDGAFIEKNLDIRVNPRFGDWRIINSQALVVGDSAILPDGRLQVRFRLWDTYGEAQLVGMSYVGTAEDWRQIAHRVSDAIYERLTGESGYFNTRIVFVAESGPKDQRVKRLAIMDQDGAGYKNLTSGRELVLTPRFSPTLQEITYMSYYGGKPRVYLFNLETGQQEILGDFPGMSFAPRFSPDGNKVIMSLARSGNSDVYVMDLRSRVMTRLTDHASIDTSPSYAPDQSRVVFNSDRGGSQQLYVMDGDGSNVKRISFGKGRYATPVWSPRGDLIAFTKLYRGKFYIGVMRPDGTGERLLTESFLDEAPTWSPNGRVIMFFRQEPSRQDGTGGRTRLWSVDLTGYNEREILTPSDASDPAWSPLIQ